jgi:hypothetical protein
MQVDRVVVTTFPGYFFSTALCLQSIEKYFPGPSIEIIVDDFDLTLWPNYVNDCKTYITQHFPNLKINFYLFSQLSGVDRARAGGWFRQQLIKLHLDILVPGHSWLLIDADVVLQDTPDPTTIPSVPHPPDAIGLGNRQYVKHMLQTSTPWLREESESDFICVSGIPIRYLTKDLLQSLRRTVEQNHNKTFLDLHLDLIATQDIVAYDASGQTMIMSEFELIEVYRNRFYQHPVPIRTGANRFVHTSIKDWNLGVQHFNSVSVPDHLWKKMLNFSKTYI